MNSQSVERIARPTVDAGRDHSSVFAQLIRRLRAPCAVLKQQTRRPSAAFAQLRHGSTPSRRLVKSGQWT